MVVELVIPALVAFAFVNIAAYAGALRALEIYHDPDRDSIFLSDDGGGPETR